MVKKTELVFGGLKGISGLKLPGNIMRTSQLSSVVVASLFLVTVQAAIAGDFQVIVNASVKDQAITKDEIKQIFMTNQLQWKDKSEVKIVGLSPDAPQADEIAKEYMGMTSLQAKKFWLTKVFNNVLHSQPPLGDTPEEVVEKVASTAGAIGIVPKATKVGAAKVLQEN